MRLFGLFVAASILLHLAIFAFIYLFPVSSTPPKRALNQKQEILFVKPVDFDPPSKSLPIVDIAKPKIQQKPKKAKYISPYNSRVKKETVAKKLPRKVDPKTDFSEGPREQKITKKSKQKETSPPHPLDELSMQKPKETSPSGKKGKAKKKVALSDLQLKTYELEDFIGDYGKGVSAKETKASTEDRFVHDYMPGIKIDGKTFINTAGVPNVQYFSRLKRTFRIRFNPTRSLQGHFRHNRVVVGKVNVTMGVEVGPSGQLQKLFVIRTSGIPGYDQESLRTIRQSSPFKSPPKNLLNEDGTLRMTWNFTTYL